MHKKKMRVWSNRVALLFFCSTAALLLFGIFSQVLCELMGYDRGLLQYLLGLAPAIGAVFLLYIAVVCFPVVGIGFRLLAGLLLIAVLLWSLFMGQVILGAQQDSLAVYRWEDSKAEIRMMQSGSRLFGHGAPYDPQEKLPADSDAEAVFSDYRKFHTLTVLSYHYGTWVSWVYAVIAMGWCMTAGLASFLVYRWWEKCTYFFCYGLIILQLMLPLMWTVSKFSCCISHPFSGNWAANVTLVAPQLGVMFGLVKVSIPRGPLLLVPDEAFWKEIVD